MKPKRTYHRILLALIVVVSALSAAGVWAWTTYQRGMALADSLAELEQSIQTRDLRRWVEICAHIGTVGTANTELRASLNPVLPITSSLAWVSADIAAAAPLLDASDHMILAGRTLCAEAERLLAPVPAGMSISELGISRLAEARPGLALAEQQLNQAQQSLDLLAFEQLHPSIGQRLVRVEALLPEVSAQLRLIQIIPRLLGADSPRRYLLVAQNPDELRATGGFISAAGMLRLENGQIGELNFRNSPLIDRLEGNSYPFAPEPMRRYMVNPPMSPALWVFRDANWSPDLGSAGETMLNLYQLGQGERPDGVIVFTPKAIELILRVTGPIAVTGQSAPVGADDLEDYIRLVWSEAAASGRADQRKESLNRLGEAILDRLERGSDLDLVALTRALTTALDRGELAIHLPNDATTTLLAERNWDGRLRPGSADFLHVAGANIGYNKVGPSIRQELRYALDLSDLTNPLGAVTVTHYNRSPGAGECIPLDRSIADNTNYLSLTEGCYWSYLRVFVPGSASLLEASIPRVPDHWMLGGNGDNGRFYREVGEAGTQVYSALTVVPRSSAVSLSFRYALPSSVVQFEGDVGRYRLRIERQPGTVQQATVQILLPAGAELLEHSHPVTALGGPIYQMDVALDRDATVELVFRMGTTP